MREDTPLPFAARTSAGITQELDPSDILEVQDMAAAIARAEKLVARSSQTLLPAAAPSSSGDIFESLGRPRLAPTDDTVGAAISAPVGLLTPIPPAYAALAPAAPAEVRAPAPAPSAPRYVTMPSATGIEEDAFYHPVGRMRSLADATLDGYRPEPTLLVRAASRRKRFSWLFVAALLPLLALAAIAIFASTEAASPRAPNAPTVPAPSKLRLTTTSATSKVTPVTTEAAPAGAAPVFDVNSLPAAGIRTKR